MKHLVFLIAVVAVFSCQAQTNPKPTSNTSVLEPAHVSISSSKAASVMKTLDNLVVIDVRTPEEVSQGKIEGALEIDFRSKEFKQKIDALDRNVPYMVYCHAGGRSKAAMQIMKDMGFVRVYDLKDGYRSMQDK